MADRREEKERLRQQRLASQQSRGSSEKRRLILGYVVAGILGAAVLAGLFVVLTSGGDDDGNGAKVSGDCDNAHIESSFGKFDGYQCDNREGTPPPELQFGDLEESAAQAKCEMMLDLEEEGNTHFTDENKGTYETNPPTSGDHFGDNSTASGAIADGAYQTTPPESRLVHSMEHGRVEIRYDPDLPEDQQLALKGVFDEDPGGMIMVPDPDLPFEVAFSAWTNAIGCPKFDPLVLDVARNFRDTYRGNGPENFPVP
jgi:hypothetical protein